MGVEQPNVVVIAIDTLRADHLSANGYFRETDPTISTIAREGVTFEDYYASGIATGIAFTSLLSGHRPVTSEYYANPYDAPNGPQLDDDIPTMPEIFQAQGYQTAAVDNLASFRSHPKQFTRGYEYFMNPTQSPDWIDHHEVVADDVNEYVLPWLESQSSAPFFLFVHYWDPHLPYNQPAEFRDCWSHEPGDRTDLPIETAPAGYEYVPGWGTLDEMVEGTFEDTDRSIDRYDGEISYVDDRIGEVYETLERTGHLDDTIIAVVGDHGEQFGQDGIWDHKALYDSVTQPPLVMRGPGLPAGQSVAGFGEHVDLLPTLMDLAGIETVPTYEGDAAPPRQTTPAFDGESLLGLLGGNSIRDRVLLETHTRRAIRTESWKYIHDYETGEGRLFDLAADPMERNDRAGSRPEMASQLREELFDWVAEFAGEEDPIGLEEEKKQA